MTGADDGLQVALRDQPHHSHPHPILTCAGWISHKSTEYPFSQQKPANAGSTPSGWHHKEPVQLEMCRLDITFVSVR